MPVISGRTGLTGIIGWPVAHSLSPLMHNAAFRELGLDMVYVPFPVRPELLPQGVAGLAAVGVTGFNVTIPHKVAIVPLLDEVSPEAAAIGAVNTVLCRDGRLVGHNTDGVGLLAALREEFGFEAAGRRVLVIGAGGAGRSAAVSLARAGAAGVCVANRSAEKGKGLVAELEALFGAGDTALSGASLAVLGDAGFLSGFDLVVNTTSVGMHGSTFDALDLSGLPRHAAVYDMVYAPPVTPLMEEAKRVGIPTANGLSMLIAQGEAAFAIWTGGAPPSGCMKRAVGGKES